jgi:broad specificity phosphatase PhoE
MKVFLIRHAESESNVGIKTSNPETIAITKKGELQAKELANKFNHQPDLIIVTTYLRTSQTASPLINKFPSAKIETWPLHEFTYLSPTQCLNTTPLERLPLVQEYWKGCDPDFIHGIGAESFSQFATRIADCLHNLQRLNHSTVLIFTHSQVMQFIKQYLEIGNQSPEIAMKYFRDKMLSSLFHNTEMTEIQFPI